MWIHGRTRGSVNTSVQMQHSVISSSSLPADDERAILQLCIARGVNFSKLGLALGISSETKAELNSSGNVVQNNARIKLLITINEAIVTHCIARCT